MKDKLNLYLKLTRFTNPTGYLLAFFSSLFGIILASPRLYDTMLLVVLFFVGSIIARSSGCIINDLFDRDIDRLVDRTKNRPLANNTLSIKKTIICLFILLVLSFAILLMLTKTAIYIGILACFMMFIYPMTKRITYFPQIFLGLTFNLGVLIGYATIQNGLSIGSIILYLACCFWTIGYDTMYGFMDIEDDMKIGVKSLSILLRARNYKCYIFCFYLIFILLFVIATTLEGRFVNYNLILLSLILLTWQAKTLDIQIRHNCLIRFKANNYVALLLTLALCTF